MAVLNTTSPIVSPSAPIEIPLKMEPSSSANIAGVVNASSSWFKLQVFERNRLQAGLRVLTGNYLQKSEIEKTPPRFSNPFLMRRN